MWNSSAEPTPSSRRLLKASATAFAGLLASTAADATMTEAADATMTETETLYGFLDAALSNMSIAEEHRK